MPPGLPAGSLRTLTLRHQQPGERRQWPLLAEHLWLAIFRRNPADALFDLAVRLNEGGGR
ncbi:MAG: hypothetical protein WBF71_04565 [Microthrixaceae bacterium]